MKIALLGDFCAVVQGKHSSRVKTKKKKKGRKEEVTVLEKERQTHA